MIVYIPFYFQIWAPPTPPQDDNDVYIDHVMCLGYEPSIMTESQLPSVFHKKETKKIKVEQGAGKLTSYLTGLRLLATNYERHSLGFSVSLHELQAQ